MDFEFILLFYLIYFAFLVQAVTENATYLRTPRTLVEQKQNPPVGFELYSMVPSICPLETLHNALSLKQVDEFLASIASPSSEVPQTAPEISSTASRPSSVMRGKTPLNTYTPAKILPTPPATLKSTKANSKPATSGPSSAVIPNTSSRKKSMSSKTEVHEHKKATGKKK